MPTWYAGEPKKTRSPGCGDDTGVAACRCSSAVRGRETPTWRKTHCVKPEQSNPVDGLVPPYLYGRPWYWAAMARTPPAAGLRLVKSFVASGARSVDRLAVWVSVTRTTGFGAGLGFGLAVAWKPMTP